MAAVWQRPITPSEICIILQVIQKPNPITILTSPWIDSRSQWHHCMLMPQLTDQHNVNNGARVGRWLEHSPPTNVARVQILASKPSLVWVCCWFSPLVQEVFLWVLQLSPLLKTNTSKFQFDLEHTDTFKRVYKNSKCFVGKQITIFTIFLNRRHTIVVSSVTLLPVLSTIICRSSNLKKWSFKVLDVSTQDVWLHLGCRCHNSVFMNTL